MEMVSENKRLSKGVWQKGLRMSKTLKKIGGLEVISMMQKQEELINYIDPYVEV